MIENLLETAGFTPDRQYFNRKVALQAMQRHPYGAQRVMKAYRGITKAGHDPNKLSKAQFQDWVMGIDFVIEVHHFGSLMNLAIDVTANPVEVDSKVQHLRYSQPFLRELGIDHCAVVYLSYEGDEGWKTLSEETRDKFVDQLYEQITFTEWCKVITIG